MWQCLSGSCSPVTLLRRYPLDVHGWAISPQEAWREKASRRESGGLSQSQIALVENRYLLRQISGKAITQMGSRWK